MVCTEILPPPTNHKGHFVELFRPGASRITENVGRFVADGLRRGGGALIVARSGHTTPLVAELARLRAGPAAASRNGRLIVLDAEQVLAWIVHEGKPDREEFRAVVASALEDIYTKRPRATARVYCEMVDVLREQGQTEAALALEVLWNELLEESDFHLLCGYAVDVFDDRHGLDGMDALFRTHTHVVSTADEDGVAEALHQALERVVGPARTAEICREASAAAEASPGGLPETEAMIQWVRDNVPEQAEILKVARGLALG